MSPCHVRTYLESMGHDIPNPFLHRTLRYGDSANRPPIRIANHLRVPSGLKELIAFDSVLSDSWFVACPFHLGFFCLLSYTLHDCIWAIVLRPLVEHFARVSIKSLNVAHLPHKRSATRPLRLLLDIADHVPTIMLILELYIDGWNYVL